MRHLQPLFSNPARVRIALGLLTLVLLGDACGAPASRAAKGPIAEQIEAALESGRGTFDHSAWNRLLANGTRDGRVDYDFFADHRRELDAYLESLAEVDLAALSRDELMALLINAYNALTIQSILDHPGVSSIREIDGVWTETAHPLGGFELTLDEIEHNLLRPFYKDPRIHFAVNCASASCAPLPSWAYDGARIEEQLEERTRSFLTDPGNVQVDGGKLWLSKYFDWYGQDFTAVGWEPRADTIPEFVARYATEPVAQFIQQAGGDPGIEFFEYDWSLNSAR